jgi:hypothetical protein
MTKNPLLNALAGSAYVSLVALGIESIPPRQPLLAALGPLLFLSLFLFSAGVMGYLFLWQPALMTLRGDARGGITLFLRTLGLFGLVTLCIAAIFFALL